MADSRRSEETFPAEIPTVRPERELPAQPSRANPRLNEMAEAIGGVLGNASRQVRNARDRFTVIQGGGVEGAGSSAEHIKQAAARVEEIKQRAGAALAHTRIQATAKLEDMRTRASQVAEEAKNSAVRRARLARLRAARFRAERPLTVIGIIGGAAFLLGIFLRLGRDKRG